MNSEERLTELNIAISKIRNEEFLAVKGKKNIQKYIEDIKVITEAMEKDYEEIN